MHTHRQIAQFLIRRLGEISKQERSSDHQWEHCFKFFASKPRDLSLASLHLGFYLASWGMYRGSAKIRDFDYLIHRPIAEEVLLPKYDTIRGGSLDDVSKHLDGLLWPLVNRIYGLYPSSVVVTDTLMTKILMGTLGCTPAYDRYFVAGIAKDQLRRTFSRKGFESLLEHCKGHCEGFLEAHDQIPDYPVMRLVDMYYYAVGANEL